MFELKLFIAQPLNKVVYYIRNNTTGTHSIVNAGTLEPLNDVEHIVTEVIPINGNIITKYNVNPLVIGDDRGEYYIVYAPLNKDNIYDAENNDIHNLNYGKLITASEILIPDLTSLKYGKMKNIDLKSPNVKSLQNYVDNTDSNNTDTIDSNNVEEITNSVENTGNYSPAPIVSSFSNYNVTPRYSSFSSTSNMSSTPEIAPAPNTGTIIEFNNVKNEVQNVKLEVKSEMSEMNKKNEEMRKDIAQLYDIFDALIRRTYGGYMYPVQRKTPIRINGCTPKQITVEDYNKMIGENKVKRVAFDAILQPYVGSHRSDNRILTVYDLNENIFFVECHYDPKTNKVSPCKFGDSAAPSASATVPVTNNTK